MKLYDTPSTSPGLGERLVADTENLKLISLSSSIELMIVDLPLPEGAEITIIFPFIVLLFRRLHHV
jgi:hypothetical protein